jgi:hypothetical protein
MTRAERPSAVARQPTQRASIGAGGTVQLRITLSRSGRAQLTQHHRHLTAALLLAGTASGTAFHLTDSVRLIAHR